MDNFLINNKNASFLSSDNTLWKYIDGHLIGKYGVQTKNLKVCWLEETSTDNIKSYLCGDVDYTKVYKI